MKLKKNTIIGLIILAGVFIFATFKLFNKDVKQDYKFASNLDVDSVCDIATFYDNDNLGSLSFCYDGNIKIEINEDVKKRINLENVEEMNYFYNAYDGITYFYFINNKGDLYSTTSTKILSEDYTASKFKDLKNISYVKTFTVVKKGISSVGIYAVDINGSLMLIKELY